MLVLMLLCTITGCETSEDEKSSIMIPKVKQDVYVYDQGDFLDDNVELSLNQMLDKLEEQTTVEFAVITIPSLNDLTIEKYAVKLGNELGIGKAEDNNGILLLISKSDTKVRLEIGKGMQGIITDSTSGRILDKFFVPYRDEDNYDEACQKTVQAVINHLAESGEYEISIDGVDAELVVEETPWYVYVIVIILIILFLIFLEFVTGYIWGNGFGDGIVCIIINFVGESSSGGGSFGGGGFNGGGASR